MDILSDLLLCHDRSEIIPTEVFEEMGVLQRRLHPVFGRAVIPDLFELPYHFGGIKETVEMQPSGLGRPFPNADLLPAFPRDHVFERIGQRFPKRLFVVQIVVVGERAEIIPLHLQTRFPHQTDPPLDQVFGHPFGMRF